MSNSVIRKATGTVLDVQSVVMQLMNPVVAEMRSRLKSGDLEFLRSQIEKAIIVGAQQHRYVCISSTGRLVQDVWSKGSFEEARLSLGIHCHDNFDGAEDDARVFERLDDGNCVEVYSYKAYQFICKGETEAGEPILEFDPDAADPEEDDDKYRRCTQDDDCNCYTCKESGGGE